MRSEKEKVTNIPPAIMQAMMQLNHVQAYDDNTTSVQTHCTYPDDRAVNVYITGRSHQFTLSDNGGAMVCLADCYNKHSPNWDKFMHAIASDYDLMVEGGKITTKQPVTFDQLPVAITLLANASKEVADHGVRVLKQQNATF